MHNKMCMQRSSCTCTNNGTIVYHWDQRVIKIVIIIIIMSEQYIIVQQ